jgi:hypothetical protein
MSLDKVTKCCSATREGNSYCPLQHIIYQFEIFALDFYVDKLLVTDISEETIGPIVEGPFNKGLIGCPKRSVNK